MPLSFADTGSPVQIREIRGKDEVRAFLARLGFVVGGSVCVVSALGGDLIVSVKDSRVALSRSMASRILI